MEESTNIHLKKPSQNDFYNVEDFNNNMDILDTNIQNLKDNKVDKVEGKGLSSNDYTDGEKEKLVSLALKGGSHVGANPPEDTTLLWADTTNQVLRYFNGTAWIVLKARTGYSVGSTAPTDTTLEWFDTVNSQIKYYNGTAWVAIVSNYIHPTTAGNKHIPAGGAAGQILKWSADGTATWGNDNDTTYGLATVSADGLMSKTDKSKLDGLSAGGGGGSYVGSTAPVNTSLLWIDTGNGEILKYHNGTAWTTVKAVWG